jgi:hypothetical protein
MKAEEVGEGAEMAPTESVRHHEVQDKPQTHSVSEWNFLPPVFSCVV